MKVPTYIKNAITKCAYYNMLAREHENTVRKFLDENKLSDENKQHNITDSFIDYCLYTNNAESFIKQLENL